MDPNAVLSEIRELIAEDRRVQGTDLDAEQVARLVELVQGLDYWLTSGGFPPRDWHWIQGK